MFNKCLLLLTIVKYKFIAVDVLESFCKGKNSVFCLLTEYFLTPNAWASTPHQTVLQFCGNTCLVSYDLTVPGISIRSHRLGAQSHRTGSSHFRCQSQSRVLPCVPMSPSSVWQFARATCRSQDSLLPRPLADYRRTPLKNSQTGGMPRARCLRRGVGLPCPVQACRPPGTSMWSPTWKVPPQTPFLNMEASLCRHDWLNPWPLVTNSTSKPLSHSPT